MVNNRRRTIRPLSEQERTDYNALYEAYATHITASFSRRDAAFLSRVFVQAHAAAQAAARRQRAAARVTACKRCAGTGFIQEFGHIEHGACFACNWGMSVTRTPRIPAAAAA